MKTRFLLMTLAGALLFPLACGKTRTEANAKRFDSARNYVKRQVAELHSGAFPGEPAVIRSMEELVKRMEEGRPEMITTVPEPYLVIFDERRLGGKRTVPCLAVYWLQRDADVAAMRIRELWADERQIVELYAFCAPQKWVLREGNRGTWVNFSIWNVAARTHPELRKNEGSWKAWLASTAPSPKSQPPLYVARPSKEVRVLVSLVDEAGNEGGAVRATLWTDPPATAPAPAVSRASSGPAKAGDSQPDR